MMHIAYSPLVPQNLQISPLFFQNFKYSYFRKNYVFVLKLVFFAFHYFDHDAFTHHALHVLDGSGRLWPSVCVALLPKDTARARYLFEGLGLVFGVCFCFYYYLYIYYQSYHFRYYCYYCYLYYLNWHTSEGNRAVAMAHRDG